MPLDSVIVILLTPATRARYFVAELGVKRLLGKAGATTIDTRNSAGETALHIAASKGRAGLVEVLLDKGASIDAATDRN